MKPSKNTQQKKMPENIINTTPTHLSLFTFLLNFHDVHLKVQRISRLEPDLSHC